MTDHETKIKKRVELIEEMTNPNLVDQAKAEKLLNRKVESSCFTSPSRETLWLEGMRETIKKPGATLYHPRTEYVLRQEAQMPRIPEARPNPGKEIKHRLFEQQHFKLCNRLIDRLNKGYDESKRDSISRELIHDPAEYQNRSLLHGDFQTAPNRSSKHKRSMTTIGQVEVQTNSHINVNSLNNTSSVDIRIARERESRGSRSRERDSRSKSKDNHSREKDNRSVERDNPGPGSSRLSQGPTKSKPSGELGRIIEGQRLDRYVIGQEFPSNDPREPGYKSQYGKIG